MCWCFLSPDFLDFEKMRKVLASLLGSISRHSDPVQSRSPRPDEKSKDPFLLIQDLKDATRIFFLFIIFMEKKCQEKCQEKRWG